MAQRPSRERNLMYFYNSGRSQYGAMFSALFSPFAATVEVFLRTGMGVRYFNSMNFIAGLLVLGFFRILFALSNISLSTGGLSVIVSTNIIYLIWLAYIGMSIYHFMQQWYRETIEKPNYSLYLGDSRLFFLGKIILGFANKIFQIPVRLYAMGLSGEERKNLLSRKIEFWDYRRFTYRYVEPAVIFIIGWFSFAISGLLAFWLLCSGVILTLHTEQTLSQDRDEMLDLRDSKLFSSQMEKEFKGESESTNAAKDVKRIVQDIAEDVKRSRAAAEQLTSPTVAQVLANLNPNLKNSKR